MPSQEDLVLFVVRAVLFSPSIAVNAYLVTAMLIPVIWIIFHNQERIRTWAELLVSKIKQYGHKRQLVAQFQRKLSRR